MTITLKSSLLTVIIGLLLPVAQVQAGSASQDINFTATFYGGSCDVVTPNQVTYNNGDPVSNDTIPNNEQNSAFTLTLSNCTGYFMAPKISVTGDTIKANNNEELYADASSTTKGYGVRLSTPGNSVFNANTNTARLGNNLITAKNWPVAGSDNVATLNRPLTFNAVLACGTCVGGANLHGGNLAATVTFTFLYN